MPVPQLCPTPLRGCRSPSPGTALGSPEGGHPAPYLCLVHLSVRPAHTHGLSIRLPCTCVFCLSLPPSVRPARAGCPALLGALSIHCSVHPCIRHVCPCPSVHCIRAPSTRLTYLLSVCLSCACSFHRSTLHPPVRPLHVLSLTIPIRVRASVATRVCRPPALAAAWFSLSASALPLCLLSPSLAPPAPTPASPAPAPRAPTLTAALSLPSRPKQPPPASKPSAPARAGPPEVPPSSSSATTSSMGCRSSSAPCWCGVR